LVAIVATIIWLVISRSRQAQKEPSISPPTVEKPATPEQQNGSSAPSQSNGGASTPTSPPETTELRSYQAFPAKGTAKRSFADGSYSLDISAETGDPYDGFYYQVWLFKHEGEKNGQDIFLPIGKLEKKDSTYVLRYTSDKDLRDYPGILASKEKKDMPLAPGPMRVIMDGFFTSQ